MCRVEGHIGNHGIKFSHEIGLGLEYSYTTDRIEIQAPVSICRLAFFDQGLSKIM